MTETPKGKQGRLSPLELLHPDGAVGGVAVFGESCPTALIPKSDNAGELLDLVIIAPGPRERRQERWLENVLDAVMPRLAADGIVYLLASRLTRARAVRRLGRRGLRPELEVAHVPNVISSRYLVPLEREATARAFSEVVAVWPRRRRLLSRISRLHGAPYVLAWVLPSVAVVARREGGRPLFDWLSRLVDDDHARLGVIVSTPPPEDKLVVLSDGAGREQVPIVVKIGDGASDRLDREEDILREFGPNARMAEVEVPEPRAVHRLAGRSLLLEDRLEGESAAALLVSRAQTFSSIVNSIAEWLENWSRATVVVRPLAPAELRLQIHEPAELLADELNGGEDYAAWVSERARAFNSVPFPVVSAHNDLTMFNVLVGREKLGIVDWESAAVDQFPLTDFAYAAVDAAAAAARYEDRAAAFEDCFGSSGRHVAFVGELLRRLATAVGASAEAAELSFHACWLHHAANEQRKARSQTEWPFVSILRQVAARRDEWPALFRG